MKQLTMSDIKEMAVCQNGKKDKNFAKWYVDKWAGELADHAVKNTKMPKGELSYAKTVLPKICKEFNISTYYAQSRMKHTSKIKKEMKKLTKK